MTRFSAIARSVMISTATAFVSTIEDLKGFSAIARSVMMSTADTELKEAQAKRFSAIARSVMISTVLGRVHELKDDGFSAIARSVMISTPPPPNLHIDLQGFFRYLMSTILRKYSD